MLSIIDILLLAVAFTLLLGATRLTFFFTDFFKLLICLLSAKRVQL